LDAFCCETDWAVQNPGTSITQAPATAPPDGSATSAPTFDVFFCQRSMASSDLERNDKLNKQEYVIFLNRLTNSEFIGKTYDQLDAGLQANYGNLAGDEGNISIFGSKPDQKDISVEQENNLSNICLETSIALNGGALLSTDNTTGTPTNNPASTPTPTALTPVESPPTVEPSVQMSLPPSFDTNTCDIALGSSDPDADDYLSEEEYTEFVIRLTGDKFEGLAFKELPSPLPDTYYDLVPKNETGIYIYGSKPGDDPDEQQKEALQRICLTVAIAYSQTEEWTSPPLVPPPGTFAPGFSEGYNSFIVSNRGGLTSIDLVNGLNRDGLDQAYNFFIEKAIEDSDLTIGSLPATKERSFLRRRKLAVDLSLNSPKIYLLEDSDCPEGLSSTEKCQIAFAKFQLTIDEEDAGTVSKVYTDYTQSLISQRVLEIVLKKVDPRTTLKIVNASYPVVPETEVNAQPPTGVPGEEKEEEKTKKKLAGPILGGLFVIILICVIVYVYFRGLPFQLELPSFLSFLNRGRGRVGNKGDDNNDEGGLVSGQDDDGRSNSGKGSPVINNNTFVYDDDDEDDEEGHTYLNRFGFAKKKKKNDEENPSFGLDSRRDLSQPLKGSNDDLYAFEEPSEADSESDTPNNKKSVDENDDNVFGGGSSQMWGTDNVFGADLSTPGWGANEAEDNFFGTPEYPEEKNKDAASRSGSKDSGSYSSDDDTYESGEMDESDGHSEQDSGTFDMENSKQENSFSESSADFSSKSGSISVEKMSDDLKLKNDDMNAAIDNGDWDAVVQATKNFGKSDIEDSGDGKHNSDDEDDDSDSESYSGSGDGSATSATTTSEERENREEYRAQVEDLVKIVLPDETEKVGAMMDQFKGREAELVSTLQTMEERSGGQRARAAVHKSKPPAQQQNVAYTTGPNGAGIQGGEGSAAGTAAIAAASLPIPAEEMLDGDYEEYQNVSFDSGFERQNAFGDEGEEAQYKNEGSEYSNEYDDDRSYLSEDGSASRSYYSDEEDSQGRSVYSDEEGSQTKSVYSEEEGSRTRSVYSDEDGSQTRSVYSDEEGSQIRSAYSDEEGSREWDPNTQEEGSQERSYYSDEEGSEVRSFYSQEGSRSYYSGEGSYRSGEEPKEGSYFSDEGSQQDEK